MSNVITCIIYKIISNIPHKAFYDSKIDSSNFMKKALYDLTVFVLR